MLSRKNGEHHGASISEEKLDQLAKILNDVYSEQQDKWNRSFFVYGSIFKDELLLTCTFSERDNEISSTPVSFFLSADITEKTKFETLWKVLIDQLGQTLDEFFGQFNQSDYFDTYTLTWEKINLKGQEIHLKITREDVALFLKAQKLLSNS